MSSRRQEWADYISSPNHCGRFLASLGDVAGITVAPIADELLNDFFAKLTGRQTSGRVLVDALDLLFGDYSHFFLDQLPDLLRALEHETVREQELANAVIKGRINWPATLTAQHSYRIGPAQYFVRRPFRSFNVPENQILLSLLEKVSVAVDRLIDVVGTGSLHRTFSDLAHRAGLGLRSYALRSVTPSAELSPVMVSRVLGSRRPAYRKALELLRRRMKVEAGISAGRTQALYDMIRTGWLAPISDDTLFEVYLLVLTLTVLEREAGFGPPSEYGLVISGRSHVAKFERSDGVEATVFFNQGPSTALKFEGKLGEVFRTYEGLTGNDRRPDLLVRVKVGNRQHTVLIEAKRSTDGDYSRDSVYKMFGYLHDYEGMWTKPPDILPRAVLVFPSNIRRQSMVGWPGELEIVGEHERRELGAILKKIVADLVGGSQGSSTEAIV